MAPNPCESMFPGLASRKCKHRLVQCSLRFVLVCNKVDRAVAESLLSLQNHTCNNGTHVPHRTHCALHVRRTVMATVNWTCHSNERLLRRPFSYFDGTGLINLSVFGYRRASVIIDNEPCDSVMVSHQSKGM
jgi:hypothetical protein